MKYDYEYNLKFKFKLKKKKDFTDPDVTVPPILQFTSLHGRNSKDVNEKACFECIN